MMAALLLLVMMMITNVILERKTLCYRCKEIATRLLWLCG